MTDLRKLPKTDIVRDSPEYWQYLQEVGAVIKQITALLSQYDLTVAVLVDFLSHPDAVTLSYAERAHLALAHLNEHIKTHQLTPKEQTK